MQKHRFIRDARLEKINANRSYPQGMTYGEAVGIVKQIIKAHITKSSWMSGLNGVIPKGDLEKRVGEFTLGEVDQALKIIERGYSDE